jgi:hypothetical protein
MAVAAGHGRIALIVIALLLLAPVVLALGRIPGADPVRGANAVAGFHQRVGTDHDMYGPDEPVLMTYEVCRTRPWPTQVASGHAPVITEFRIVDQTNRVVADTGHRVYPMVLIPVRWWPGQCRSVEQEWDQRYWNQHPREGEEQHHRGAPIRRDRVEPGIYRFEVWWNVSATDEAGDQVPDPITTETFELRP